MNVSLLEIYVLFLKIGAMMIGGGYVVLPLLTLELTEKRNWLTKEEVVEYYSISQCIPGIIAVNSSVFAGYKLRGKLGAIVAALGVCTSPFLVILIFATILSKLVEFKLVENIFWGVGIGIIVMIYLTVKEIWQKSIVDKFSFFLFLIIFLLTVLLDFSPVWSVLLASFIGIVYKYIEKKRLGL